MICNCMGCRGECEFDRCLDCGKILIADHYDSWVLCVGKYAGPNGARICKECAERVGRYYVFNDGTIIPTCEIAKGQSNVDCAP